MPTLYLMQKDAETRLDLDQAAYDRIVEAGRIIGYHSHIHSPIVSLRGANDIVP